MTQYYSNTKEDYVNINDMHHQHVWYAFKKLCDRLEELTLTEKIWKEWFDPTRIQDDNIRKGYVRKDVYEMLFDKCERLEKNANSRMVFKLEKEVSRLRQQIRDMYAEQSHPSPRYQFCEIPNDEHGESMIKWFKNYLNTDRYTIRVRGQHLDNTKLGKNETWRDYQYGQPIDKSSHLRVYIDQKKERK
tara:strand:+ start:241 stop:807 length:567 start_codon:yes stop_codon:yes gene_type:complete